MSKPLKQKGDFITISLGGKILRAQVDDSMENQGKIYYDVTVTGGRKPNPICDVSEDFIVEDENWPCKDIQAAGNDMMLYLAVNHNPHTIAIISATSVEIYSGEKSIQNVTEHLLD